MMDRIDLESSPFSDLDMPALEFGAMQLAV
jgi:hypothetical protein